MDARDEVCVWKNVLAQQDVRKWRKRQPGGKSTRSGKATFLPPSSTGLLSLGRRGLLVPKRQVTGVWEWF